MLNIPGFIERLCKLATRKVSEATGANFLQELEEWYTWLDSALVLDALMQMATEEAEQSSTGERNAPPPARASSRRRRTAARNVFCLLAPQSRRTKARWPPAR